MGNGPAKRTKPAKQTKPKTTKGRIQSRVRVIPAKEPAMIREGESLICLAPVNLNEEYTIAPRDCAPWAGRFERRLDDPNQSKARVMKVAEAIRYLHARTGDRLPKIPNYSSTVPW